MTDSFTASNGIQITMDPDRDGKVYLVGRRARGDEGQYLDTHVTGGPEGIAALREFFQHERDEERGLWRSPTDPSWTAVRRNTTIYFQNEDHERSFHFVPKLEGSIRAWSADLQALAYEYIEAHPERKPWEDAKAGDVWVIEVECVESFAVHVVAEFFGAVSFQTPTGNKVNMTNSTFTGFRKIWPEDAS